MAGAPPISRHQGTHGFDAVVVGDASTGAAFIFALASAPTDGTSGSYAGIAEPGSLILRTDTPKLYQNTNTKASPTWTERT